MTSWLSNLFSAAPSASPRLRGIAVEVRNTRDDISTDDVLQRLDDALALIEAYQPIRLAHLRRDVRAIRVERFACRGAFDPTDRTVITELTFLARRDITAAPVASSILHEGVHARVHAFREHMLRVAREQDGSLRDPSAGASRDMSREERLCRRAELTFGMAVPTELGAPVIARASDSLALDDVGVAPVVDWDEAVRRIRDVDARA